MRDTTEFQASRGTLLAAMLAIAATYFYFLIFAEFALLELAKPIANTPQRLRLLMTVLGAGGIAGSLLAAWRFRLERYPRQLANAFRGCGLAAVLALIAQTFPFLLATAAAVGVALGWLTVTLAAGLRAAVGTARLGLVAGVGTGLAYAACNLPFVFNASAQTQAIAAAIVVIVAALVGPWMLPQEPSVSPDNDYKPAGAALWIAIFMGLVWLDSAAFYVIQHTPALREATWSGDVGLLANAAAHLGAAVLAGVLLDRGWRSRLILVAFGALAIACVLLDLAAPPSYAEADLIYAAGVSLYSAALVYYPARGGRRWIVGLVYAVSGWIGSAMGIGMAQQLNRVPWSFLAAAAIVIVAALVLRRRSGGPAAVGSLAVMAALGAMNSTDARAAAVAPDVALGREVYISEGCIHCHSQFVRPSVAADVERWGPAKPLEEVLSERPPLPGNRRQGPDLAAVGSRRTPEWNRLHLIMPRAVSPGSRMPSYASLFTAGDVRGEALIAYLATLGADAVAGRQAYVATWTPRNVKPLAPRASARLFTRLCANCHGEEGRGDGALASRLSVRPPDWSRDPWRFVTGGVSAETAVARIVKFGLPGSPMAGHEYLTDAEIIGVARHVEALHHGGG